MEQGIGQTTSKGEEPATRPLGYEALTATLWHVLIDTATRWAGRRIRRQLGERKLSTLALTHVHPDHQGLARTICECYSIPLA